MITQMTLREKDLDQLYDWVDSLVLSRPKKNITRDFSDATMMAELIYYHYPKIIEVHNYPPTNALKSKLQNWITLANKVLSKMGINLTNEDCRRLSSSTPLAIEPLLHTFRSLVLQSTKQKQQNGREGEGEAKMIKKEGQKQVISNKLQTSSKLQQLREVLNLIKQKISIVQRSIQRKDAHIRELQQILKQYTNEKL